MLQILSDPKQSTNRTPEKREHFYDLLTRAIIDAARVADSLKIRPEIFDEGSGRVRVCKLAEFLESQFPSINTRMAMYLDHKLFSLPPLQYSPQWSDQTELAASHVVSLLNPLLSPIKRYHSVFSIYNSANSGFDFTRLGKILG